MIEIARILCPIDFSDYSADALDYALAMARWYGARVTGLHVVAAVPAVDVIPALGGMRLPVVALTEANRTVIGRLLDDLVARHAPGPVPVESIVRDAPDAHREILAYAREIHADLIVIGSHGRSGFERLVLGSTTDKILRKAPCPVMVIPPRIGPAGASTVTHLKRILCPLDFSESSTAALMYAVSLAQEADADLTLLHVIEIPPALGDAPVTSAFDVDQARAAAEAACLRRVRALLPDGVRQFCTVHTEVTEGRPWLEILRLAARDASDLVVMGVHGSSAFDLLLFGTNTQHVIRAGTCPVLTVRAGGTTAITKEDRRRSG